VQGLRKISMALRKEDTGMKHLPQAWSTCHNGMAQETDAAVLCAAVNERSWCSVVPNMYVSGKISGLRPGTQTVKIFGT
jgi:hypothetical protein